MPGRQTGTGAREGDQKRQDVIYVRPTPIAYTSTWHAGFAVLIAYHAGTFEPGIEDVIEETLSTPEEIKGVGMVAKQICADYKRICRKKRHRKTDSTVAEVFDALYEYKFGKNAMRTLGHSRKLQFDAAFRALEEIWDRELDDLGVVELQEVVNRLAATENVAEETDCVAGKEDKAIWGETDCIAGQEDKAIWGETDCGAGQEDKAIRAEMDAVRIVAERPRLRDGKSFSSILNIVTLIKELYRFALPRELCSKNYGEYITMPKTREVEHYEAFSDEDLRVLWQHADDEVVKNVLIMCYSGFRVSAFGKADFLVDQMRMAFVGGVKTAAGKRRTVPIHSAIMPLVRSLTDPITGRVRFYCGKSVQQFRRLMKKTLRKLGVRGLTPHSCRHTFNRLLEKSGVLEADRKRLMGHSLKGDVLNGTYGHRSVEELRSCVEKVKVIGAVRGREPIFTNQ